MELQKLGEDPPGPKQNVPDQREKETQIFGEEGKEGGNTGTVLTHCQRKLKKRGGGCHHKGNFTFIRHVYFSFYVI